MSQGNENNTLHQNAIGWFILACVFAGLIWLVWSFFEYEIKDAYRWYRWGEMWVVSQVVSDDYSVAVRSSDGTWVEQNYKEWLQIFKDLPRADLDGTSLYVLTVMAMKPFKIPIVFFMGLMGFWALFRGPNSQYRGALDLNGLIQAQADTFPSIKPFVKFDPGTLPPRPPGAPVPVELPLFAEALGPEEWLAYNQIPIPDGLVDQSAAYVAFARQLGPRWQGVQRLPAYKQVLMACCCLKASRKRSDADDMLGRLAAVWSFENGLQLGGDKTLVKEARAVLKNRDLAGTTLAKCNQHGFQTTAMLRALQTAREEGGVLAPAQFVWLRAHDRVLWYPLNNLGRQAFHMEALGAMAHFKAEKMTQRPIPRPKVEEAVNTIVEYTSSHRARPIPQLDYSASKKRGVKKPKGGVKQPKS